MRTPPVSTTLLSAEAEKEGLEIVSATTFTAETANDFSVQLNEAKKAGAELVFLPSTANPLP